MRRSTVREINVTSVVRFIACICALDYIDFINQAPVSHLVEGHCGVFRFSKHRHPDDADSDRTYSICDLSPRNDSHTTSFDIFKCYMTRWRIEIVLFLTVQTA